MILQTMIIPGEQLSVTKNYKIQDGKPFTQGHIN